MNYCSACGSKVQRDVPAGDDRPRDVCPGCGAIHYQNPKVVVGCVVEHQGRLLLCRRAIEPRVGYWTCPGGFLELDEGTAQGAARETWEEARARVDILGLHSHFDIPHIGQAYVYFRARLRGEDFGPGEESLEVRLFEIDEIPWDEIAFPVLRFALEQWVEDRRRGRTRVHLGIVEWQPGQPRYDVSGYRLRDHIAEELAPGDGAERGRGE